MFLILLLAGLLTTCHSDPKGQLGKHASKPTNIPIITSRVDYSAFCSQQQYPLHYLREVDLRQVKDYFRNHTRHRLTGERWRLLNWDRFQNDAINYEANPPDETNLYAFHLSRPTYCAFMTHTVGDDYDAVDLYTLNHRTNQLRRLFVAGVNGSGVWTRQEGIDTVYVAIGIMRTRFQSDTLLLLSYCYPVWNRPDSEREESTPFSIDSITTRVAILRDGSFRRVAYDSVRFPYTGNHQQWQNQVGIEPYGFE